MEDQDHPLSGLRSALQAVRATFKLVQEQARLQISPEEEAQAPWRHEPEHELEAEILRWLAQQPGWDRFQPDAGWIIARCEQHPDHARLHSALEHLRNHFGSGDRLGVLAAEMYCSPYHWLQRQRHDAILALSIFTIITAAFASHPPEDILARLEARINKVQAYLNSMEKAGPFDEMHLMQLHPTGALQTWAGSISACVSILISLPPSQQSEELCSRVRALCYEGLSLSGMGREYASLDSIARTPLLRALALLYRYDKLDYATFWQCALLIPESVMNLPRCEAHQWDFPFDREVFLQELRQLRLRTLDGAASHLSEANQCIITNFREQDGENLFSGSRWLLLAAENHARLQAGPLQALTDDHSIPIGGLNHALILLAQARDIEPASSEERRQLIQHLRRFPSETLKRLLPVAHHATGVLCEALDWQAIAPLLPYIVRQRGITPHERDQGNEEAVVSSPSAQQPGDENDFTANMLDLTFLRACYVQASDDLVREVLTLFREAKDEQILFEAFGGWNRQRIEKSLKHNMLLAIEAYGLLPLRDQKEIFERYQALQEKYKVLNKLGPMRRVSHRRAIQRALTYLAQIAGYADVILLELAMEARTSEEVARDGRTWTAESYTLQLHHDGLTIELSIARNGRSLKAVPPVVRKTEEYKEAQELVKTLRTQASRLRMQLFEKLLTSGTTLSLEHIKLVTRVSTARAMLERLILCSENGELGLFDTAAFALRSLDGLLHPVTGPVRVAHPYDLYQSGMLADWQSEIVHRRIVQPVKQVFRELYLLTPAELQAGTASQRFANRRIDDRIAGRLFGARQWRIEQDSPSVTPYKPFPGMRAIFNLRGTAYFMGAQGTVTTDAIFFERYPLPPNSSPQERTILLQEVPPRIFSEVMRDADLVVSVAQQQESGQTMLSDEAYEKRGELVSTLLADLGLEGVEVDGHFAYVQGKLARYRVHLNSASIHIEPGSYLCIIPSGWGEAHEQLFLPFIEESDSKIGEIISKIFLLLADDQITDESILRQIRTRTS